MENVPSNNEASSDTSALSAGLGVWVPIAERQPPSGTKVLFCCAKCDAGGDDVGVGFYLDKDRRLWLEEGGYWMQCPKAPDVRR